MKNKQNIVIGTVVVVALIAAWYLGKTPEKKQGSYEQNVEQASNQEKKPETKEEKSGQTWNGTLKASDNSSKGNYILSSEGKNLYIKTSRDFNSLVGKEVVVSYKGTPESFVLENIVAK